MLRVIVRNPHESAATWYLSYAIEVGIGTSPHGWYDVWIRFHSREEHPDFARGEMFAGSLRATTAVEIVAPARP